jgi:hypothetical protein
MIRDNYDSYAGFVILHGSDTMAFSAAALSFMLQGIKKPASLDPKYLTEKKLWDSIWLKELYPYMFKEEKKSILKIVK